MENPNSFSPIHEDMPYKADDARQPEASKPTPTSQPIIGPSRQTLITVLVAVIFFAAGLLVDGMNEQELAALVRSVISQEMAKGGGVQSQLINNIADDPSFGDETAPITIIEFSDFYCGYCVRFATETLPQLQAIYGDKIKFVYRDMPVVGQQAAVEAAVAANCANVQGKFWEFHDLLFANQAASDATTFIAFAGELGLDTATFETCLNNAGMVDEIQLDLLDAQGLGITGTPAFYVNGRFVTGAQPLEIFQLVIDKELEKLGIE